MFDYEYWGNGTFSADLNMALEEFFLKRASLGKAIARFFSFPRDCVVLGYAQANDPIKKLDNSFDLTRRITGGSHVQTGSNIIAYSFAVPRDGSFRHYEDMRAYYAALVAEGLGDIGIKNIVVDNKASTINVDGKIIASHAIIWGVESALLHGLIILDSYDVDTLANRIFLGKRKIGNNIYSEYAALKNLPAVSALLNNVAANSSESVRTDALKGIIAQAVLRRVTKNHKKMAVDERTSAESLNLIKKKFGREEWLKKREPPFTKTEIEAIPDSWESSLDGELKRNLGYCLFLQVKDKDFKKMCAGD